MVGGQVITQFVSILELPLAHVTGKFLLFIPTVNPLVPLQTVVPLIASPAIVADVLCLKNARVGIRPAMLIRVPRVHRFSRPRRVRFLEQVQVLIFPYASCPPLQQPQRVVLPRLLDTCGKSAKWQRLSST